MDEELEEGEIAPGPGYHSPSDTEEYYNHDSSGESDDEATSKTRRYFVATSNGEASCSSSVAVSNNGYASASSAVAAPPMLACSVCGKEFNSSKAVCGHMKVHALDRHEQGNGKEVKRIGAVARGWGDTGKRGCSASGSSRSVSPNSEPDNSMAIVAAEPKLVLQPMPLAYAATSLSSVLVASGETDLSGAGSSAPSIHNDAMAIVAAGSDPSTEAIAHHHQAAPPPPTPLLPAEEQAPPVHRQRAAPTAAGTQNPDGYTCGECGKWFRTHQALGGHVGAHKNRRLDAAEDAGMLQDGAVPCRRGPKPEKRHVCRECSAEFATGVQLGGHMRKHWKGGPIAPNKKQRLIQPLPPPPADLLALQLNPADDNVVQLRLALPFEADVQLPAPAVEWIFPAPAPAEGPVEAVRPAPEPPATGRVLLFGVDIGPGVQRPRTREGSPATKDSADIGGQQQ